MAGCIWLTKDGCKGLGGSAVGYWGRDVYKTVASDNQAKKQVALLEDQVSSLGIRAYVWRAVTEGNTCSCYKSTYNTSDRKCRSCHGAEFGRVPGYFKFGYKTVWMASSDSDLVLTNTKVTTEIKSAKITLLDNATQGTIESGDKAFNRNAIGSEWEYDVASYVRVSQYSSIKVEFSLNSGSTWSDIAELITQNPSTGSIRFRITLLRDDVSVLSPLFEIIRARYAEIDLGDQRGDGTYHKGPFIKIMPSVPDNNYIKEENGDIPLLGNANFWTIGLGAFDPRIERGSRDEMLVGPNIVIGFLDGFYKGTRWLVTSWQLSDPGGYTVMTQYFNCRAEDPAGPMALIW